MNKIYVCHTAYHLYITCIKKLVDASAVDHIVLMDNIPNVEQYGERLKKLKLVEAVSVISHNEIWPAKTKKSYHLTYFSGMTISKRREKRLEFLLDGEVYLFTDYSNIGSYLLRRGKTYHLLEDGCDTFALNKHIIFGRLTWLKKFLYDRFEIPYAIGLNKNCVDIEVNNKSIVKTDFPCPVLECNRKELIAKLDQNQISVLKQIFCIKVDIRSDKPTLLFLSTPFTELHLWKDDDEIFKYLQSILKDYFDKYQVFVKPHPRDVFDYERRFGNLVTVLDRTVPIEILNYSNVEFDLAISFNSTSVNGIEFCKRIRSIPW